MADFLPDASLQSVLDAATGVGGKLHSATLHLFVTNHANNAADTAATYNAIEATAGGYASQTITDWGASTIASNIATSTAGVYTFTFTGSGLPFTIYGAYVLDAATGLIYADLVATGGVTITAAGQTYSYRPRFTMKNQ
jgi:hypothetical protein